MWFYEGGSREHWPDAFPQSLACTSNLQPALVAGSWEDCAPVAWIASSIGAIGFS